MDQQPKIPTLKDSQKPQVKVRGGGIGLTLAERLKQFKKKDLAFILAGLGVLFMAPLAEHFMMAPETADGSLQAGWGKGGSGPGSSGVFGGGGSPYDRTDGLAPGSPTGGGSDVITPLNVRDPSALVMGPGAAQQPPTNSALPAVTAPSARSDSDLKDALAASARGVGAAARKASLPMPKASLSGVLRGLGAVGGSSGASASLGPISAGNVPNRASGGDSTGNARSTKGYNGVARGQSSGGGGMEALKAAAGKQGDNMSRGGGAAADLNAAAQTAIPSGGGGGAAGGPSAGKDDKGFSGNQDKGNKTTGESLEFMMKKKRMEAELDREMKKAEANDMGLLWANVKNEGIKTFVSKGLVEPFATGIGKCVGAVFGGDPCFPAKDNKVWTCDGVPHPEVKEVRKHAINCIGDGDYVLMPGAELWLCKGKEKDSMLGQKCENLPVKDGADKPTPESVTNVPGAEVGTSKADAANMSSLGDVCKEVDALLKPVKPAAAPSGGTSIPTYAAMSPVVNDWLVEIRKTADNIASVQNALVGVPVVGCNSDIPMKDDAMTIKALQEKAITEISGAKIGTMDGYLQGVRKAVSSRKTRSGNLEPNPVPDQRKIVASVGVARTQFDKVQSKAVKTSGVISKSVESDATKKIQEKVEAARASVAGMLKALGENQSSLEGLVGTKGVEAGIGTIKQMAFQEGPGLIFTTADLNERLYQLDKGQLFEKDIFKKGVGAGITLPESGAAQKLEPVPALLPIPESGNAKHVTESAEVIKAIEDASAATEAAKNEIAAFEASRKQNSFTSGQAAPMSQVSVMDAQTGPKAKADAAVGKAVVAVGTMQVKFAGWVDATKSRMDDLGTKVISQTAVAK